MKQDSVIKIGFLVALAVLASIMFVSQGHLSRWTDLDSRESYTFNLIRRLDHVLYGLKDVTKSQRGYSRTGKEEYRRSYEEARNHLEKEMADLDRLAANHPRLRKWLLELEPLVRMKLAQRQLAMNAPAGAVVPTPPAQVTVSTDEIRRRVSAAQDEAISELRHSSARQLAEMETVQRWLLGKAVLIFLMICLVFFLLRRDVARRRKSEQELIEHRDQLDGLVATRTRELEQANQRLHDLNEHLDLVREEERLAISREVHDGIGQSLTALQLDLNWLELRFTPDQADSSATLRQMHASLDELIAMVQHITAELRPPLLDNLGLAAAIEWQAGEFGRRSGIECHLMLNEGITLDQQVATNLMRIFLEALTNIVRHAHCSEACISLCQRGDGIIFEVSDNGCGIDADAVERATSYGIMGMRERARLCRGELSVTGEPGQGTTVRLQLPFHAAKGGYEADTDR